ncbi:right-handed parallel beta-helix repeat-containing protein [Fulvivirgaceae bacterium PWU4]|uniref:Right-handed parallel beta-helix repeat-containing protein n=1 Tax=Chryseosolibacter histidini TaxID=2782349 RepID=A0AAP2GQP4_9BACT|nr:right-handed parallel beta-helix repeat-containing protein [Chryseosolibacter histidini]MBT1700343.1 right-handed parallel beta-helix repeat-containing protein [Chryseosolibacter histidini]
MKILLVLALLAAIGLLPFIYGRQHNFIYVSTSGNDASGDGTREAPWRTIHYATTQAKEGQTLKLSDGIFAEEPFTVPPGVNIEGQGKTRTIIKPNPSFYYNPPKPGFTPEKYLIHFSSPEPTPGNQYIKKLMIDGENKRLHGGIYINRRNGLHVEDIRIQNTNFNGLWLWDTDDTRVTNVELKDCSWGSVDWCNGALDIGNVKNIIIENCIIDEGTGYGIKSLGPDNAQAVQLVIHHSHISVNPKGLWNNGMAPNISIELFNLKNSQIHDCYIDNHISVAGNDTLSAEKSIRIHHNTIDLDNRAGGQGYGIELNINNVEVDNNFFIKGFYGIVNWGAAKQQWDIHHNVFYGLQSIYPTEVLRSQTTGLHNVRLHNNTVELTGTTPVNLVGVYGGNSNGISIMNNLVIDAGGDKTSRFNEVLYTATGTTLNGVVISSNFFERLSPSEAKKYLKENYTGKHGIMRSGNKPLPYYMLKKGSSLIDAGQEAGYAYEGKMPDVGAYEYKN